MTAPHTASPFHPISAAPGTGSARPVGGLLRLRLRHRLPGPSLRVLGCLTALLAVLIGALGPMLGAAPALAAPAAAGWQASAGIPGTGYFVGQHRNADGVIAYCTDFERRSPEKASGYTDGTAGPFVRSDGTELSAADNAALAFVLGRWGATSADGEAAAVQLAVWSITAVGMGWDSPAMDEFMADQALPAEVGSRARGMVEQAHAEAGPYSITASFDSSSPSASSSGSSSRLSLESTVVSADGAARAGLQVSAVAEGAVFAGGSTTTGWTSTIDPQRLQVERTGFGVARVTITAPTVPPTQTGWLTPAEADVQRLVVAPVSAAITSSVDLPSVPGFTPEVSTSTSAERTEAGSPLFDVLEVAAAPPGQWLVDPASGRDVTLDVVSTLWGPLPAPPAESASVPTGTPSVGSVTTTVSGPGRYETATLAVPSAGYYVWTETIEPSSVRPVEAAPFVEAWAGRFGLVPETTLVPWEPSVTTQLTNSTAVSGDLVKDTITAKGFNPAEDDDVVRLTMYGPLNGNPTESPEIPPGARVHSELEVPARNGTTDSGEFAPLVDPGCYTVVASFAGSTDETAFTSAFGIPEETVCMQPPPVAAPESGPTPALIVPTPDARPIPAAATPGAPEPQLAETGVSAAVMIGLALIAVGSGMGLRILARRDATPES